MNMSAPHTPPLTRFDFLHEIVQNHLNKILSDVLLIPYLVLILFFIVNLLAI